MAVSIGCKARTSMTRLLECTDVIKVFGGIVALNGASFHVNKGEILGLVGPNGSGKTTMINVISGQYNANYGKIFFNGKDVTNLPANRLAHAGIARTYQIPRPFVSQSVIDNVALACMFGRERHSRSRARELAMTHLAFVGLAEKAHLPVTKVNLHERKFLEMARALALEPQLLLLDEVLAGLNPAEIELGIELVKRIRDSKSMTLVFVEHNMRAVTSLSDRMVVFNQGRRIAEGTPDEVMQNEMVISAYLGEDYAQHP
jgi:ABC-type branched-subunit amino acid transport system ATPase component